MDAISLFSGAMGLDLGLEQAGIRICCALEFDPDCCNTIRLNRPELPLLEKDILEVSADEILRAAKLRRGEVGLVCGGPPCQSFSTAGKRRGFKDKRGGVFPRFLDIATDIAPSYILIENVRGLWSASRRQSVKPSETADKGKPKKRDTKGKAGTAIRYIVQHLNDAGYSVTFALYDSANYGVPQNRERIIMIASSEGGVPLIPPTHTGKGKSRLRPWATFREAVANLDGCTHIEFQEKILRFIRELKEGQNWRHLNDGLKQEALGGAYTSVGGRVGFYRRLAWDKPSPTLLTIPTQKATLLAHPEEDRPLSIEEYRAVQQFPADWRLKGSLVVQYKQIGNAVPVGLGAAVGRHLLWWSGLTSDEKQRQLIAPRDVSYSRYVPTDHIAFDGKRARAQKYEREKKAAKQRLDREAAKLHKKLVAARAKAASIDEQIRLKWEAVERSSLDPNDPPAPTPALPPVDMPQRDFACPEPGDETLLGVPALGGVHPQ